jgi:hypothetical protein
MGDDFQIICIVGGRTMRTALCSTLALAACTSVALAEPSPPAAGAKNVATAEAHAAGPVTLTEAEMDEVAAGAVPVETISFNYTQIKVTYGKSARVEPSITGRPF